MPYLNETDRVRLEALKKSIESAPIWSPGDLNYLFTLLIKRYLEHNGMGYGHCNDVIGALECCKLELYRRKVAPYEDLKIKENGDVYE